MILVTKRKDPLIYTHEYKKAIFERLTKLYPPNGGRHIKIGLIDDHIPTIDGYSVHDIEKWIDDEFFIAVWDDIIFQGSHKPKAGGISCGNIQFKEPIRYKKVLAGLKPEYIKFNLLEQDVIGVPNFSTIIIRSQRGKEYPVQKSPEYDYNMESIRKAPANSKVTALIDTITSPWTFVEIKIKTEAKE